MWFQLWIVLKPNPWHVLSSVLSHLSYVWLFATPWTAAHQAPLSTGFSRQEHWSGLSFLPPGDVPGPRRRLPLSGFLHRQVGFLPLAPPREPSCQLCTEPNLGAGQAGPALLREAGLSPSAGQLWNAGLTHSTVPWRPRSLLSVVLTLCDRMEYSPPGSSVLGILQARTLEWVVISSSRGSSWPRDQTHISCIGKRILYH